MSTHSQPTEVPKVSVLMPTYEQRHFIERALDSLLAQTFTGWEAVIIDDGSQDQTRGAVSPYLDDRRIRYYRLPHNTGLGNALNQAIGRASARVLAYLPSDDVYYPEHLESLYAGLDADPGAVLAYSGVRYHYNRYSDDCVPGQALQLVQCMHRRTALRWTGRDELESDDLDRLYWTRLRTLGDFVGTRSVSCEWVDHPGQRHKIMQEPNGGINPFRRHYRVRQPLRFHTTVGNAMDEAGQYHAMRARPQTEKASDGLKILLVGELAYNADRVLALEEQGHTLYGLWTPKPAWFNTVGPLPFGHVQDLPQEHWREAIDAVRPDLIYAQLNWQAVPFAHEVLMATRRIPFVWHFKEGPFICIEKGTWPQLAELYRHADGRIFSTPEMQDWFETAIPGLSACGPSHVLDGDLPKKEWFDRPTTALLSASDGELHTVVPGRPIGLHPPDVASLAAQGIHLHFYGDFTHGQWRRWIEDSRALAPTHLHLHANVDQGNWVQEFSRYDAGWLHAFESRNYGEIRRANWDDLNYPARISTMAAAGLPMIQRANEGSLVATQSLARRLGFGIFFDSLDELGNRLREGEILSAARERIWQERDRFTFDYHVPELLAFFRAVICSAAVARPSMNPITASRPRPE